MTFTRRAFLVSCGLTAVSAFAKTAVNCLETPRPNLLIVFPDQMRGQAMGFMNMDPVRTPRLDAFAQQSYVFTQAVSNYPVCSPFRGILMSGALPWVNGVTTNCVATDQTPSVELREDLPCWSDVLHNAGYDQYYIGKWHLDAPHRPWIPTYNNAGATKWNEWCPPQRRHGFNRWYAYGTYDSHLKPMYWETEAARDGFKYVPQWGPEHEADKAIAFLKETKKAPFTLVVSMNPPHTGYELVPQRYYDLYKNLPPESFIRGGAVPPKGTARGDYFRKFAPYYFAAITGVDEQFGRILDALKATGHEQDTIVLFCSDHGCCLGAHGLLAKNNPYEESMRIPCLIRWQGHITPKMNSTDLVDSFDLAPTLLGLLNQPIPPTMIGRNLTPTLLGEKKQPLNTPCLYLHLGNVDAIDAIPGTPLSTPPSTLPERVPSNNLQYAHSRTGRRGLRGTQYKIIFAVTEQPTVLNVTLFDLRADPDERENLATRLPEKVASLRAELKSRLVQLHDPFASLL
ncbi:MAG: sulfatase-like hydrolase/transferase [Kiritimatiellia bacterium]